MNFKNIGRYALTILILFADKSTGQVHGESQETSQARISVPISNESVCNSESIIEGLNLARESLKRSLSYIHVAGEGRDETVGRFRLYRLCQFQISDRNQFLNPNLADQLSHKELAAYLVDAKLYSGALGQVKFKQQLDDELTKNNRLTGSVDRARTQYEKDLVDLEWESKQEKERLQQVVKELDGPNISLKDTISAAGSVIAEFIEDSYKKRQLTSKVVVPWKESVDAQTHASFLEAIKCLQKKD